MTSSRTPVIFIERHAFKIGLWTDQPVLMDVPLSEDATTDQIAAAITTVLKDVAPAESAVTLAIPSDWCLCAAIENIGPARSIRRTPLLYQLEEHLPLTAEEMVADYIPLPGDHVFASALRIGLVQPLMEALEKLGWVIASICPAVLLAAQGYTLSDKWPACDVLAMSHADQIELLRFVDGRLAEWVSLPATEDDVVTAIGLFVLARATPLRLCYSYLPPLIAARLRSIAGIEIDEINGVASFESATSAVHAFGDGGASPWIQLRRDALGEADRLRPARKSLRSAFVATVAFVLCASIVLAWRTMGYQRLTEDIRAREKIVFRDIFKGKGDPDEVDIPSRLASEERRLRLLTGQSSDAPVQPSAMLLLQQLLARISPDANCQINELRLGEGKLYLEAAAPSHADGAAFVAALSADRTFDMESPRSEQIGDGKGVAIVVTGSATVKAAEKSPVNP